MYVCTRWFKYDRDYLCANKSQFVPVIFEPPCIMYSWFVACLLTPWTTGLPEKLTVPQLVTNCSPAWFNIQLITNHHRTLQCVLCIFACHFVYVSLSLSL